MEADSHKDFCFEKMKKFVNLEIYSLSSFPGKVQQSVFLDSDYVCMTRFAKLSKLCNDSYRDNR